MSLMNEERKRRNHHLLTLGLSGPVEKRLLITQEELLANLTPAAPYANNIIGEPLLFLGGDSPSRW
jgi:hypothetical protein